jgi:hypothetical protein
MPTKGTKRKAPTDEEEPAKEYAVLRPRTYHVSRSAVRNRWETLPASTQGKVRELLKSGERPTIMIHREERRRLEAQQAVNSVQDMWVTPNVLRGTSIIESEPVVHSGL